MPTLLDTYKGKIVRGLNRCYTDCQKYFKTLQYLLSRNTHYTWFHKKGLMAYKCYLARLEKQKIKAAEEKKKKEERKNLEIAVRR